MVIGHAEVDIKVTKRDTKTTVEYNTALSEVECIWTGKVSEV